MSKKCLVTASLVGSVRWAQSAPSSIIKPEKGGDGQTTWATKAVQDLKATLGRAPFEPNIAATRGIAFENSLYKACRSGQAYNNSSPEFLECMKSVIGGSFQKKAGMNAPIAGEDCYLYAKEDVYFSPGQLDEFPAGKIIDIKTTGKFKEDSYVSSFQHILYAHVEKIYDFEYIVAEWDNYPKIKKLHRVPLVLDPDMVENLIESEINKTFNFLKKNNLWTLYREKYCLY